MNLQAAARTVRRIGTTTVACAAVAAIAAGGAVAGGLVSSAQIADGTIRSVDVADGSIYSVDVADGSVKSSDIRDGDIGTTDLAATPVVRVSLSESMAAPINTMGTPIPFDVEEEDAFGMHSQTHLTRLVAPVSGLYLVTGNAGWFSAPDDDDRGLLLVDQYGGNIAFDRRTKQAGSATANTLSAFVRLDAGEYVTLRAWHSSNGARTVTPDDTGSYDTDLTMAWVAR